MNGLVFFLFGMAAGYWLKCVKDNWMRMREEGDGKWKGEGGKRKGERGGRWKGEGEKEEVVKL